MKLTMLQYSLQEFLVFLPPLPLGLQLLLLLEFLSGACLPQPLPLGALVRLDVHSGLERCVAADLTEDLGEVDDPKMLYKLKYRQSM